MHDSTFGDFQGKTAQIPYHLVLEEDGAMVRLNFLYAPPDPMPPSGSRVEVIGHRRHGRLDAASMRVIPGENL